MRNTYFNVLPIVVILIFGLMLNACTAKDGEEKKEAEDNATPVTCIKDIEAIAVGEAVYRYSGGLWAKDETAPEDELPWFAVDFLTADFGWASGTDKAYLYENGEWSEEDPGIMHSGNEIRRIIATPDKGAWAMANVLAESGGVLLRRTPDGAWDLTDLDDMFNGNIVIKDIMLLADNGVMALLQESGKRAFLYFIQGGQDGPVHLYDYDPANFLDFSSLGLSYSSRIMVGGSKIDGLNRTGFLWYQNEESAFTPFEFPASGCPAENIKRTTKIGDRNFVLGDCSYSVMYLYENALWSPVSLPGEKSADWMIHDFDFIDPNIGWAVGYDGKKEQSTFMLRDTGGWTLNPTCYDSDFELEDAALYGVSSWRTGTQFPEGGDDDTADDDTMDDDVDDDTADEV